MRNQIFLPFSRKYLWRSNFCYTNNDKSGENRNLSNLSSDISVNSCRLHLLTQKYRRQKIKYPIHRANQVLWHPQKLPTVSILEDETAKISTSSV